MQRHFIFRTCTFPAGTTWKLWAWTSSSCWSVSSPQSMKWSSSTTTSARAGPWTSSARKTASWCALARSRGFPSASALSPSWAISLRASSWYSLWVHGWTVFEKRELSKVYNRGFHSHAEEKAVILLEFIPRSGLNKSPLLGIKGIYSGTEV